MKSLRSRALISVALLALTLMSSAQAEDWNNPGEGDWFDPTNWTPNAVPTDSTDANINNGGTAVFGTEPIDGDARNLNVGVDGGEGTLRFNPGPNAGFLDMNIAEGVRIGVTETGASASTGTWLLQDPLDSLSFFNLLSSSAPGPFRVGVSEAEGDANGVLNFSPSVISILRDPLSAVQWGVAEGSGNASATVEAEGLQIREQPRLEIGVSRAQGLASAEAFFSASVPTVTEILLGVVEGNGNSEARVQLKGSGMRGPEDPSARGDAALGVSRGPGYASLVMNTGFDGAGGLGGLKRYDQIDIGVAYADGDATADLEMGMGIDANTLNVGLNLGSGSGTGTGRFLSNHGQSDVGSLQLGPGATLALNVGSDIRSQEASSDHYANVNADSAALDGRLEVNFRYVPGGPTRFELLNTTAADGISGDFAEIVVNNLNPGLSWTSGVVSEAGVEKYVLDVIGTPQLPEWSNPATGDWFTTANWSTGLLPDLSQPALINNGGEAEANANTAPGPLQAFEFLIGIDGGSGSLASQGVAMESLVAPSVGVVQPGHSGGGTATGSLALNGVNFTQVDRRFPTTGALFRSRLNVGAAYAPGSAVGQMQVENAALEIGGGVRVGFVELDDTQIGQTASADGTLLWRSVTLPDEFDFWAMSWAQANADASAATAGATVTLEDTTLSDVSIVRAEVNAANASASASATASLSNVTASRLNFMNLDANQDGASVTGSLTANISGLSSADGFNSLQVGNCDALAPGSQVQPSSADVTIADSTISSPGGLFELADIGARQTGEADCTVAVSLVDSTVVMDMLRVARVDPRDDARTAGTVELTFESSSLQANTLLIADVEPQANGVAGVDAQVQFSNSTADIAESVRVGFYDDDGAAAGNTVTVRLGLTSSALDTPLLEIGVENPANLPLDAEVSLNPSYIRTDDLQLGDQSRIVLAVEGPTRATRDNLDQTGLYAAIDTGAAMLAGDVIVDFRYPAEVGDTFDVLRADPGALGGSSATFQITGALPGEAQFDIVSEAGQDVLRVTVNRGFAPLVVPVNQPLALLLLIALMAFLAAAFMRNSAGQAA